MNDVKSKWPATKIKTANNNTAFSICDGVLLYMERVVIALTLQKDFKIISRRIYGDNEDEVLDEKLCVLAKVRQKYPKYS